MKDKPPLRSDLAALVALARPAIDQAQKVELTNDTPEISISIPPTAEQEEVKPEKVELPSQETEVSENNTITLVLGRKMTFWQIYPVFARENSLTLEAGEYEMWEVQDKGVRYYAAFHKRGCFYGKSVGDLETICKVERTETSTTLTYT